MRKEAKILLYPQVCLNCKQDGEQQPEKGIQYTFVFLFPMPPQLQNFKSSERADFSSD